MPRKIIASPKADSVGSLLIHSRDPFQVNRWKAEELARQREQYAEELKLHILEKELARARENAVSHRFAAELAQTDPSIAMPSGPLSAGMDPRYDAQELNTLDPISPTDLYNNPNREASMAVAVAPLPRAPVLTGRPAVVQEPTAMIPPNHMSEKERFIASMEHGITRSPTYAHRSMTLPAPLHPATARAAATGAMPLARSRTAEEEEAEALRRQQSFKADLEIQIQEKKRQKALELEKEKQWEAEQEARLEKEREELRKEFEAEHAARRAKFEADAAENAAAAAVSRKGTVNTIQGSNEDVQIYAPKRKNTSMKAQPPSDLPKPSVLRAEPSPAQTQRAQRLEENNSSPPPPTGPDPKELSRKLQQMDEIMNIEEKPVQCRSDSTIISSSVDAMPVSASVSAQTAALTEQVEELKRLNEALQRDLSLHKTVLELVKDTKLAFAPSNTTFATAMQPPLPQQLPIYINPLALGLVQPPHASQPTALLQSIPPQSHMRSLPIVYTASELRTEDSRPPTRMTAAAETRRHKSTPTVMRSSVVKHNRYLQNNSDNEVIKAVRPEHHSGVSFPGPATAVAEAGVAHQKVPIHEAPKRDAPATATTVKFPPLETARLGPAGAAERLGIWKKAKLKLRKLSVAKPTGAKETMWVLKEESSAALGPSVVNRTRSLQ